MADVGVGDADGIGVATGVGLADQVGDGDATLGEALGVALRVALGEPQAANATATTAAATKTRAITLVPWR
jgi:hypothetical protein